MEKPANTEYPIHELLRKRWSPRAFDSKPMPAGALDRLFEAARWAASSYNEQPWRFIVAVKAEDPAQFERLASILIPLNGWAKAAPVLALSLAKTHFSHAPMANRVAGHDVGAASASLTLEATSLGLFVHQMAGFDGVRAKELFEIPDEFEPVAVLAIGYPGDPEQLSPELKEREMAPRTRKPFGEFVFKGKFGGGAF